MLFYHKTLYSDPHKVITFSVYISHMNMGLSETERKEVEYMILPEDQWRNICKW